MKHLNLEAEAHEPTFSCYKGLPPLLNDRTRTWFIGSVEEARSKRGCSVSAFVVIPECIHIIIRPNQPVCDTTARLNTGKLCLARGTRSLRVQTSGLSRVL